MLLNLLDVFKWRPFYTPVEWCFIAGNCNHEQNNGTATLNEETFAGQKITKSKEVTFANSPF